jgi:hypothetical protein
VERHRPGSSDDESIDCAGKLHSIQIQMDNDAPAAGSDFGRLLHDAVITAIDGRNTF